MCCNSDSNALAAKVARKKAMKEEEERQLEEAKERERVIGYNHRLLDELSRV